jgi:photosystem II stability/assembly factor-like uncharacterized protein
MNIPAVGWPLRVPIVSLLLLASLALPLEADERAVFAPHLLKALAPRSIGPANMSGRITDVAVVERQPRVMYVASASGGLWKTRNNGITWDCVFDRQATVSLGAVAVAAANPDIVWVGTGEANPRNSVSWGDGVYKTTDGGKTWTAMGLQDTHHIGRIVIHPTNPDIVYVAALGHLWGASAERGLYRSGDGGRTWDRVKFIDLDTGFIDVAMDPGNPDILYAAAWQVRRDAFAGGNPAVTTGPGSGLYRTSDGGKSWERMMRGLPARPLGRCGLAISRQDPRIVYAVVQTDRTSSTVTGQAANLSTGPEAGGIFRSEDQGQTWQHVNSLCPRPFYYGQIRVDPMDARRIYVLGVWMQVSADGGKTFKPGNAARGTHVDYHALWIDPADSEHLVLGCDGGLNFSYDGGANWEHLKNLPVSQFYAVGVDMRRPYRIYGGLQDNGSWGVPSATRDPAGLNFADWFNIFGADGFYCQPDPADSDTVYAEGQYGMLRRIDLAGGIAKDVKPRLSGRPVKGKRMETNLQPPLPEGTPALRFNWSAPILLSPHKPHTVYFGGNHVFRSLDRGEHWEILGPDLTRGKPGPSPANGHTITTLAESPLKPGLLYAGSDDGKVHVSRDGGRTWLDLSERIPRMPADRWISRIECSRFAEGTAYLAIDRHRNDDREPYVFRTIDFGMSWQSLANNLPAGGPVHVIREDPRNKDLLYVGTEFGLFVTVDGGGAWHRQTFGLPTVAVHDLVVHSRDRELVIATHGRGIYVMDVAPLQEMTARLLAAEGHLFDVKPAAAHVPRSPRSWAGSKTYLGANPPFGAAVYYYLRDNQREAPRLTITDGQGKQVAELETNKEAGLHRVTWPLRSGAARKNAESPPVPPGDYYATLRIGDSVWRTPVRVDKN